MGWAWENILSTIIDCLTLKNFFWHCEECSQTDPNPAIELWHEWPKSQCAATPQKWQSVFSKSVIQTNYISKWSQCNKKKIMNLMSLRVHMCSNSMYSAQTSVSTGWDVPLSLCPATKKFSCPGVPLSRDKGRSKCPRTNSSVPGHPGIKSPPKN